MTQQFKHLKVKQVGKVRVVRFVAKKILDDDHEKTIGAISQELFSLMDAGVQQVLLDLRGLEYMEELMLGKILALHGKLVAIGGRLIICNARARVFEKFDLLHTFKMKRGLKRAEALKLFVP